MEDFIKHVELRQTGEPMPPEKLFELVLELVLQNVVILFRLSMYEQSFRTCCVDYIEQNFTIVSAIFSILMPLWK